MKKVTLEGAGVDEKGMPVYVVVVRDGARVTRSISLPMTDKKFPAFRDAQSVVCFQCSLPLAGPFQASGFAPGHGEMRATCTRCGVFTHFDLAPPHPGFRVGDRVTLLSGEFQGRVFWATQVYEGDGGGTHVVLSDERGRHFGRAFGDELTLLRKLAPWEHHRPNDAPWGKGEMILAGDCAVCGADEPETLGLHYDAEYQTRAACPLVPGRGK